MQENQKSNFRECIAAAEGFDVLEQGRFETVERSIKQLLYQMNHLAKLWKVNFLTQRFMRMIAHSSRLACPPELHVLCRHGDSHRLHLRANNSGD